MNYDNVRFYVTVEMPNGKTLRSALEVEAYVAKPLLPLSRYHDAPFEWNASQWANQQLKDRHELINLISRNLAIHIYDQLHEQDPYNGYDRSELRATT